MPLIPTPIDLPPDVVEIRAGDIDMDGLDELVAIERKKQGTSPDTMVLTVYDIGNQAQTQSTWSTDLYDHPLLIDIEAGLWAVARDGIAQITAEGTRTQVQTKTALTDLGRTTPTFADVFVDIEGDGSPEGVIAAGNTIRVVGVDGVERARVPVRPKGALEVQSRGGTQVISSSLSPTWNMDDIDGDGFQDLLLPEGNKLTVYRFTDNGLQDKQVLRLPINIEKKKREGTTKSGETERRVISVWLEDLDNDGKTDFAAQIWVTKGSWMGAEGEIMFAKGTGSGFATPQQLKSDNAVLLVRIIDIDGDGDKEIASAEVDFGVANLTRAMLSQKIKVDLMYREMTANGYTEAADLHSVVVPVGNDRDPPVKLEHDITGDGIFDLVTSQGSKQVQVFKGTGKGFEKAPFASLDVDFVQGEDKLWVGDLTGDGRAEILVWRLRTSKAHLLQLR